MKPRCRIHCDAPLAEGSTPELPEETTHYLLHVMRAKDGEAVALFNARDGEWLATLHSPRKKTLQAHCVQPLRAPRPALPVTVCFAPIKGGRLENIIEKATELGAARLQPVRTARTIVGHVNEARLAAIAREAAEQCERTDMPEILPMLDFAAFLGNWAGTPLFYGDESGASGPLSLPGPAGGWGTLCGPEGGFTPEEFAMLGRKSDAVGVALGPRILRADTACLTLLAITAEKWGDWHERPHFTDHRA